MGPIKWKIVAIGYVLALALFVAGAPHPASLNAPQFTRMIDLTSPLANTHLVQVIGTAHETQVTRLEAPSAAVKGRWSASQIPAERLTGPLVVLDVSSAAERNPDYEISLQDIVHWERSHGAIPTGAIVMARTGWHDSHSARRFPGYSREAARFLVDARKVFGIGIDTPSLDRGSRGGDVRQLVSERSVYALENVANLRRAPQAGSIALIAAAESIQGDSGPVRVMALLR